MADESESTVTNSERKQIAAKMYERSGLTQKEVGEIIERSAAWVSKAHREHHL